MFLVRISWTIENSGGRGKDTTAACVRTDSLLQPYHDAVGRTFAVDHGEPHETWPFRREKQRATSRGRVWQRHAIDQHGERASTARNLECDRLGLAVLSIREFEPRAVGREHDAQCVCALPGSAEALQWRRQLRVGRNQ